MKFGRCLIAMLIKVIIFNSEKCVKCQKIAKLFSGEGLMFLKHIEVISFWKNTAGWAIYKSLNSKVPIEFIFKNLQPTTVHLR